MDGEYSDLMKRLKRLDGKKLDALFHRLNDEESEKVDCLQCANCCRTLGPRFIQNDIARMATHLKMKESAFISQYLRIDEDGDYVFKEMPCPFLMPDNYCMLYNSRTKACREYPHTDSKNIRSILKICELNAETCPIVRNIFERIKKNDFELLRKI